MDGVESVDMSIQEVNRAWDAAAELYDQNINTREPNLDAAESAIDKMQALLPYYNSNSATQGHAHLVPLCETVARLREEKQHDFARAREMYHRAIRHHLFSNKAEDACRLLDPNGTFLQLVDALFRVDRLAMNALVLLASTHEGNDKFACRAQHWARCAVDDLCQDFYRLYCNKKKKAITYAPSVHAWAAAAIIEVFNLLTIAIALGAKDDATISMRKWYARELLRVKDVAEATLYEAEKERIKRSRQRGEPMDTIEWSASEMDAIELAEVVANEDCSRRS
jgi:hypothetical protein